MSEKERICRNFEFWDTEMVEKRIPQDDECNDYDVHIDSSAKGLV